MRSWTSNTCSKTATSFGVMFTIPISVVPYPVALLRKLSDRPLSPEEAWEIGFAHFA